MRLRHRRHLIAWLALLGFVFAHAASAAYACTIGSTPSQSLSHVISSEAAASSGHCHEMGGGAHATPNLCHIHCQADQQLDPQPGISLPAIAPPLILVLALRERGIPASAAASKLRTLGAGPPPSILFVRFLI